MRLLTEREEKVRVMGLWRNLRQLLLIWLTVTPCFGAEDEPAPDDVVIEQIAAAIAPDPSAITIDPLNIKVERAIAASNYRVLTAGQHTPWQIVHATLGLKHDCILNTTDGKKISGIEWLATSKFHEGVALWEKTPYGGRGHPFTKPYAFEGHPTQFLGYMCMADLPLDYKFLTADGSPITVREIVNDAKMQLREGPEVTWTLWALSHYIPPDSEWINAYGESWSIERMVQIQTHESVLNAACGGTHGLFVLAYARNRYIATGKPLRGVWLEADQKIRRFIQEAKAVQFPDGTFSADYFQGKRQDPDFTKRLPANGHMLEWLMIALPQSDLKQEWLRRGIEALADDLYNNRKVPVDCGPLYHAVDALNLYNFRTHPNPRPLAYPISGKRRLEAKQAAVQQPVEAPKPAEPEKAVETPKPAETPAPAAPEKTASETPSEPEIKPEAGSPDAGDEKTTSEQKAATEEKAAAEEKAGSAPQSPARTEEKSSGEAAQKTTSRQIVPKKSDSLIGTKPRMATAPRAISSPSRTASRPLPIAPPPPE